MTPNDGNSGPQIFFSKTITRHSGKVTIGGRQDYQVEVDVFGIMDDLKIYRKALRNVEAFALFDTSGILQRNFTQEELQDHYLITSNSE